MKFFTDILISNIGTLKYFYEKITSNQVMEKDLHQRDKNC